MTNAQRQKRYRDFSVRKSFSFLRKSAFLLNASREYKIK